VSSRVESHPQSAWAGPWWVVGQVVRPGCPSCLWSCALSSGPGEWQMPAVGEALWQVAPHQSHRSSTQPLP
jgi:hypothetical protein